MPALKYFYWFMVNYVDSDAKISEERFSWIVSKAIKYRRKY